MSSKFPYQNRLLIDMAGEEWRDITGYENYYQVSNYGRIKSLPKHIEFLIPGKHIVSYWKPEKILAQGVAKMKNSFSKEIIYQLTVTFCVAQKMKTTQVSRVVWKAFGSEIEFEKDGFCVLHKDGDGRNNQFKNLTIGIHSIMAKAAYKRGRIIKLKEYWDESSLKKRSLKTGMTIAQYDLNGHHIKTYHSIGEAGTQAGIFSTSISKVAKGKELQAGGFIWRYGKGRKKIDVSYYHDAIKRHADIYHKTVTQYDLSGNKIKTYPTIKEAAEEVGISASAISNVVRGVAPAAKGFIWKYGKGEKG